MTEFLYRLDFHKTSNGLDDYDDLIPGHGIALYMSKFKITKRTPKGAWILKHSWHDNATKFVLLTARKQYASETEEKAVRGFLKRKERHRSILASQIKDIDRAIYLAQNYKVEKINVTPLRTIPL